MSRRKTSSLSLGELALGGLAGAGLLYLIFKPKDAVAASTKTCPDGSVVAASASCPSQGGTKTCPDGSVIDAAAACPATNCADTPATNTAPVPMITVVASGSGAPAGALSPLLPNVTGLPSGITTNPCITSPTDAFVYLQAYDTASGYQAVFPDGAGGVPSQPVGLIRTDAAGTGVAKATNKDSIMGNKNSFVSNYFDAAKNPKLGVMETPGTFVLVWTADQQGNPLAWWLTTWASP